MSVFRTLPNFLLLFPCIAREEVVILGINEEENGTSLSPLKSYGQTEESVHWPSETGFVRNQILYYTSTKDICVENMFSHVSDVV